MAIDTAAKRRATLASRSHWYRRDPILPDGTISAADRANLNGHYFAGAAPVNNAPPAYPHTSMWNNRRTRSRQESLVRGDSSIITMPTHRSNRSS